MLRLSGNSETGQEDGGLLTVGEIVEFPQAEDRIWRCDCGCATSYLLENGRTECAGCRVENTYGHWTPPLNLTPEEPDEDTTVVRDLPDAAYQSRRLKQEIEAPDVVGVMVLHDNGRVYTWAVPPENERQIRWFRRKVRAFLKNIGADWKRCP